MILLLFIRDKTDLAAKYGNRIASPVLYDQNTGLVSLKNVYNSTM